MTPRTTHLVVALVAVLLTTSACLPTRFTIDLAPNLNELEDTVVIDEQRTAGAKVVLVDVNGPLSLGAADPSPFAADRNVVDRVVARLERAERDDDVRAVLLRVNSPGGTVAASETLYHELRRFRERTGIPIVASMGEIATSGGYYVALAGDEVYAHRATITGSVGVIIQTFNFSEGLASIGVDGRAVVSRSNKDVANPFEPADEAHYVILQNVVNTFYAGFREHVRQRRPEIPPDRFDELTDGRVIPGDQAANAGLVDGVTDLRGAFDAAKRLAGIDRADLVAYTVRGREPASLYANTTTASAARPTAALADIDVSLLPRSVSGALSLRPGVAYYIWTAAAN